MAQSQIAKNVHELIKLGNNCSNRSHHLKQDGLHPLFQNHLAAACAGWNQTVRNRQATDLHGEMRPENGHGIPQLATPLPPIPLFGAKNLSMSLCGHTIWGTPLKQNKFVLKNKNKKQTLKTAHACTLQNPLGRESHIPPAPPRARFRRTAPSRVAGRGPPYLGHWFA